MNYARTLNADKLSPITARNASADNRRWLDPIRSKPGTPTSKRKAPTPHRGFEA
ncbi:hypothetical protein SALB1_0661 [Salinisphaera sp. LB1]|nr:hypothetical protein SALB1_0661 [Salinisphaera sp. LB1]